MAGQRTIKQLYALALAESEGVGTAYEYYAKRQILLPWLAKRDRPQSLLVAGLPEKYGLSLDLILLGQQMGCRVTVLDDRQSALARLGSALSIFELEKGKPSTADQVDLLLTDDLANVSAIDGRFDLALSSEVVQRLSPTDRKGYVGRLLALAPRIVLFAPNADNKAHVGLSGLAGVRPEEMAALLRAGARPQTAFETLQVGYLDMPPFPPGITRSEDQRQEASTGTVEALAMKALTFYARAEHLAPNMLKRRWAHIVYAFLDQFPR